MKQKTDLVLTNTLPRACTDIKLIADHEREPTESFAVALVTLHMRTVTLKPQFAFVTILDDDNKGKLAQVNSSLWLRFHLIFQFHHSLVPRSSQHSNRSCGR